MGILEDLMRHQTDMEKRSRASVDPDAAILRMNEVAARYAQQMDGPRFKVGDIVTPYGDSNMKGSGSPHLVIETRPAAPDFSFAGEGSCNLGSRLDTRVLSIPDSDSVIVAHWVESYLMRPWKETNA